MYRNTAAVVLQIKDQAAKSGVARAVNQSMNKFAALSFNSTFASYRADPLSCCLADTSMVFDMLVLTEEGSTLQAPSQEDLLPLPLTNLFLPKVYKPLLSTALDMLLNRSHVIF
jgi:hypothetical protein